MRRTSLTRSASQLVRYLVEEKGLTVSEIARLCDVDKSFISRCKNGEREFGTGHIERIADAVGVLPGALMIAATRPDKPHPDPEVRQLQDACVKAMRQFDQFVVAMRQERVKSGGVSKAEAA